MTRTIVGLSILLLVTGCSATQRAEIPTGRWVGEGRFVLLRSSSGAPVPGRAEPMTGTYSTELTITRGAGDAAERIVIEIRSQRGPIPGLDGDRTHLIAELEPAAVLAEGRIRTYRIARAGLSSDPVPPELEEGPDEDAQAVAFACDGELVLNLHYMNGFRDTLRIRRATACKDGSLRGVLENGAIEWSETLRKTGGS
ncbi:MAG: hypothetical protein AB1716_09315 [Planctomycetota bacterium]